MGLWAPWSERKREAGGTQAGAAGADDDDVCRFHIHDYDVAGLQAVTFWNKSPK